jgi:hypothetical protein
MLLAPTLLLNAGSGAAIARPTFSRDFAGEKTLNNGTGPAITFTRASNATFFDASGTLQTASNNAPRFDHSGGSSLGLLIEEARTNSIRNSQAGGATNGVIGSGGVMPTNWSTSGHNTNGISAEILGTGTEDGLSYIDLKVSGTPTSNGVLSFNTESITQIVAADGHTWTGSTYFKLQAGATTNATFRGYVTGRTSGGSAIAGQASTVTFVPTSAKLNSQRITSTRTFSDATVARVTYNFEVIYTNGDPIDLTLRIAAPQLEQGAFATSYIPTTSAAATRAADSAVVTPISSFYNQAEGTLFAEFVVNGLPLSTQFPKVWSFGNTTNTNNRTEWFLANASGTLQVGTQVRVASVNQYGVQANASAVGLTGKFAMVYKTDDFQAAQNGSLFGAADTSGSVPASADITQFNIGSQAAGVQPATALYFRKIAYWPRRLSNSLLQQLTT